MAKAKIAGDHLVVDVTAEAAVLAERERCAELAELVAARPERYCARRGPDCVGATIAGFIRAGYTRETVPERED